MNMLEVKHLTKQYKGSKTPTINDLSFEVHSGEIFGLIGRNGMGKSTTIKCFTGIIPFEKGDVLIGNYSLLKKPAMAKRLIGYVPDDHSVYDALTGREYINFMADMYGVGLKQRVAKMNELADAFKLTPHLDKQISGYSHGMKQKICIIGALIHSPKLWVLDEPMLGLDPESTEVLCELMRKHISNGENSVLFSSHNFEMVEKLCNRVGVISNKTLAEVFDLREYPKWVKLSQLVNKYWK